MTDLVLSKVENNGSIDGVSVVQPEFVRVLGITRYKRITGYRSNGSPHTMYLLFEVFGLDDAKRAEIVAHSDFYLVNNADLAARNFNNITAWLGNRGYNKSRAQEFRGKMATSENWVPPTIQAIEQRLPN